MKEEDDAFSPHKISVHDQFLKEGAKVKRSECLV